MKISFKPLWKTLIALANSMYLGTSYLHLGPGHIVMSSFSNILISR